MVLGETLWVSCTNRERERETWRGREIENKINERLGELGRGREGGERVHKMTLFHFCTNFFMKVFFLWISMNIGYS